MQTSTLLHSHFLVSSTRMSLWQMPVTGSCSSMARIGAWHQCAHNAATSSRSGTCLAPVHVHPVLDGCHCGACLRRIDHPTCMHAIIGGAVQARRLDSSRTPAACYLLTLAQAGEISLSMCTGPCLPYSSPCQLARVGAHEDPDLGQTRLPAA